MTAVSIGKIIVVGALALACAPSFERTRRVIVPIDRDGGVCFNACMSSPERPPGVSYSHGAFACLQSCGGSRVEPGPCAGAELRATDRCWTNHGRF